MRNTRQYANRGLDGDIEADGVGVFGEDVFFAIAVAGGGPVAEEAVDVLLRACVGGGCGGASGDLSCLRMDVDGRPVVGCCLSLEVDGGVGECGYGVLSCAGEVGLVQVVGAESEWFIGGEVWVCASGIEVGDWEVLVREALGESTSHEDFVSDD